MKATTLFLLLLVSSLLLAQAAPQKAPAKPETPPTIASVLDSRLSGVERQLVGAADAMPEDKYGFAPTNGEFNGVRTFGEQIKHVASANYSFFSAMLGEKPPAEGNNENGPATVKTKEEILKYLKDSFALGHRAMTSTNEQNVVAPIKSPFGEGTITRLGMATLAFGHCFDHYGQMVEYLRMNGIVPPASRK
jgi:uncharacterized damage-inducible protein DinB